MIHLVFVLTWHMESAESARSGGPTEQLTYCSANLSGVQPGSSNCPAEDFSL